MKKLAFIFSGQGAQKVGMAKDLYDYSASVKKMFSTADSIRPGTSKQCFLGPQTDLNNTINTQPCVFCADVAALISAVENNIKPDYIAGFSLGELCAVYFAQILNFEQTFRLVCKRAEYMHKAEQTQKSSMLAIIGSNYKEIVEICKKFNYAYPANFNCPNQTVVSIRNDLIEDFSSEIKKLNAKVIKLKVSGGFHSPFMNSASDLMNEYLSDLDFNSPKIPIYSNVTANLYDDSQNYTNLISRQINHPVLWEKIIKNMISNGVDTFIEIGVGKTLYNFIKKIDINKKVYNIEDKESLSATINALND